LRERYHEISIILNNEKKKFVQKFSAEFYFRMIRKISIYTLDIIRLQNIKFKPPFEKDSVILKEYTNLFQNIYDLPYAHKIKRRRDANEPFSINDIYFH
jgi:hypothetical protein